MAARATTAQVPLSRSEHWGRVTQYQQCQKKTSVSDHGRRDTIVSNIRRLTAIR